MPYTITITDDSGTTIAEVSGITADDLLSGEWIVSGKVEIRQSGNG